GIGIHIGLEPALESHVERLRVTRLALLHRRTESGHSHRTERRVFEHALAEQIVAGPAQDLFGLAVDVPVAVRTVESAEAVGVALEDLLELAPGGLRGQPGLVRLLDQLGLPAPARPEPGERQRAG